MISNPAAISLRESAKGLLPQKVQFANWSIQPDDRRDNKPGRQYVQQEPVQGARPISSNKRPIVAAEPVDCGAHASIDSVGGHHTSRSASQPAIDYAWTALATALSLLGGITAPGDCIHQNGRCVQQCVLGIVLKV
jgi:hypothetical protein